MSFPAALWSPVEVRQTVGSGRDDVFNTISDPRTYPDWLVGAQRIRSVDRDFPETDGAKFEQSVGPTEGVTVDDATYVVESHGHRQLVLEVHVGPVTGEVEFDLIKRGEQTEVVMRERPIGLLSVLTPLVRPLLALRNRKSLQQLAALVTAPAA